MGEDTNTSMPTKRSSPTFKEAVRVLNINNNKKEEIIAAEEKALVAIYRGKQGESLNALRLSRFVQKVAESKRIVEPSSLLPTSSSAKFHTLRVYHQVQHWKGIALPPEEWGWEIDDDNRLRPANCGITIRTFALLYLLLIQQMDVVNSEGSHPPEITIFHHYNKAVYLEWAVVSRCFQEY
ncbi:hypothetical protein ScPMuIL_014507 [Solemya velum]